MKDLDPETMAKLEAEKELEARIDAFMQAALNCDAAHMAERGKLILPADEIAKLSTYDVGAAAQECEERLTDALGGYFAQHCDWNEQKMVDGLMRLRRYPEQAARAVTSATRAYAAERIKVPAVVYEAERDGEARSVLHGAEATKR